MLGIGIMLLGVFGLGFAVWAYYDMCKQLKVYEQNKNKGE